ncbi:MAG TPA: porin [Casimicrobiaceae bacterium]|nr:porin [Casimicrobiaceae bacterium]
MNKKLVAVAVAGLLAAPMAAQAQTANVTLYGRLNLDLEYIDASGGRPNVTRLSTNSSRLGVRGTESLGRGLTAIFQIESSINGDRGGGDLAGRDTFLGLQGSWGTVKFGHFLAPYDDMTGIFGNVPTFNTSILAQAALWANNGGQAKGTGAFDARLPNSLRYDTPNISGFTGSVQISLCNTGATGCALGAAEDGHTDAYVFSAAGIYNNGPFQGGIAFEKNKDVRANGLDDWAFTATAAWNFGIARVGGLYERLDYDTPAGSLKRNLWGVNVTAPIGPGTLYAAYIRAQDGKGGGSRVGGFTSGSDTGADHWSISWTYPLSKRTITYVGYSGIDNDRLAGYNYNINAYNVGSSTTPLGTGFRLNGFLVGAVHLF